MKKLFISSIAFTWTLTAFAAPNAEDVKNAKIVEANFPQDLALLKDESSGAQLTLENGLGYAFEKVDFNTKDKSQYLAVIYKAAKSPSNVICKLVVIKLGAKSNSVMSDSVLNDKDELGNCSNIEIKDLDGDKKPEVLVQSSNSKGQSLAPFVFSWSGDKLIDITPTSVVDGDSISAFRKLSISDIKIGKSNLIIDRPFESNDENGKIITYLVDNGKINSNGTFDFFDILEPKSKKKPAPIVLKPSFAEDGSYVLDVKNLSAHNRAVRAEVTVNGVIVLKPQDFCSAPPNRKNSDNQRDDDDDMDEDKCKRCSPKASAYAIVNLGKTNEIKVKVFGRGDSKIQLSLVKK